MTTQDEAAAEFATPQDLKDRWADAPVNDDDRLKILLGDASQFIVDTVPTARSAPAATRRRVTCAIVRRFIEAERLEVSGVSQQTVMAGPYQETQGFHNPDGSFYLRADEKHALGHGKQRAGNVDLLAGLND